MVERVGDDGTRPSIEDYHDHLSTQSIFGSSKLTIDPSLDYDELVNDFFAQRLRASGKSTVAAMVHMDIDRILYIWPEARFIHLIRDPRDVALSVIAMGWFGNVYRAIDKWIHAERGWDRLRPKLADDRWIEVQFADLISDHESQLRRVCEFLGVDYTEEMLSYADETDYGLPNPGRIGSWRGKMSDRDTRILEGKVGSLLTDRGFEPSGLEPLVPTGLGLQRVEARGAPAHVEEPNRPFRSAALLGARHRSCAAIRRLSQVGAVAVQRNRAWESQTFLARLGSRVHRQGRHRGLTCPS